jgi:pimeloyl-ACP methyl ester carboxylesterase
MLMKVESMGTSHTANHLRLSIGKLGQGSFGHFSTQTPSTAVIFVHGFRGDPQDTWTDFHSLIGEAISPKQWLTSDVYFFGYDSIGRSIDDSADDLLDFVNEVFPIAELSSTEDALIPQGLVRERNYQDLVLVGHSQGGVVIRWAIANAGQIAKHDANLAPILRSRVALFAPALGGYVPSRWLGVAALLTGVRTLAKLYVTHSPSATEMADKKFLDQVEKATWQCYQQSSATPAYTAHVLFGSNEQVVVRQKYIQDCRHRPQPGKDHFSVCKPSLSYRRPLGVPFADCPDGEKT